MSMSPEGQSKGRQVIDKCLHLKCEFEMAANVKLLQNTPILGVVRRRVNTHYQYGLLQVIL